MEFQRYNSTTGKARSAAGTYLTTKREKQQGEMTSGITWVDRSIPITIWGLMSEQHFKFIFIIVPSVGMALYRNNIEKVPDCTPKQTEN